MKLESQVCSLKLAKRLKELGVNQESYFAWYRHPNVHTESLYGIITNSQELWESKADSFAAFTVTELGEMLPLEINSSKTNHTPPWRCETISLANLPKGTNLLLWFASDTEADARAKCLIYLIENSIIKV